VQALLAERGITPGLAVILVGEDPASQVYVRNKIKACAEAGLHSVFEKYEATLTEDALAGAHRRPQRRPGHPRHPGADATAAHIDPHKVIEAIATSKDVDGYATLSAGELMTGQPGFRPCTPYGCMKLIEIHRHVDLRGKHAVVIGRSNTVGKPMALMLLQANATVTICHSATPTWAHTRAGRRHRGRRGQAQCADGRHGQARRDRDRRGHEPQRRGQAVWRRRLCRRARGRRPHHAGAGWRRADDHHHAAGQHAGSRTRAAFKSRRRRPALNLALNAATSEHDEVS
jgi:hypothetical protein